MSAGTKKKDAGVGAAEEAVKKAGNGPEKKEKAKSAGQVSTKQETKQKTRQETKQKTRQESKQKTGQESKQKTKQKTRQTRGSYRISRSKEASRMAREKSRLQKKKGKFKRQNYGKKKRIPNRWRRPRGIDSGHRKDEKHKPAHPRSGYMTPKIVKGLHPTGYKPVRVFTPSELEGIDPRTEAVVVASSVGNRKRLEIQKRAQKMSIQILNYREIREANSRETSKV